MSFYITKTVKFLIPDDVEKNFSWWIDYQWDEKSKKWICKSHNSGFMKKHDFPWTMDEHNMLLYMVKYT